MGASIFYIRDLLLETLFAVSENCCWRLYLLYQGATVEILFAISRSCYRRLYLLCQRPVVGDSLCCVRELLFETLFAVSESCCWRLPLLCQGVYCVIDHFAVTSFILIYFTDSM